MVQSQVVILILYLEPALSLRPLPSDVDELEGDALDVHVELVDALGRLAAEEDILLRRRVVGRGQPVKVVVEIAHGLGNLQVERRTSKALVTWGRPHMAWEKGIPRAGDWSNLWNGANDSK